MLAINNLVSASAEQHLSRKRAGGIRELTAELAEPPSKRGNFASAHINKKLQGLAFDRAGETGSVTGLSTSSAPLSVLQFDSETESSNASAFSEQSTGSTDTHSN